MLERFVEALGYPPIQRAVIACFLCGASCSLLSVFVVLMRMPLIGVTMSHAAFAGAVIGMLLGLNPFVAGFALCLIIAGALGPLADKSDLAPENVLGILFSFLMGVAFLGMGVLTRTKVGALDLMWGSLLTIKPGDIWILLAVTLGLGAFVIAFFKEVQSVLFHRRMAAASGVPDKLIYYLLLFFTGGVVSSNLVTVGGLLIFTLIVQPAATAYQLTYDLKKFFLIALAAGIGACLTGLYVSYVFDWPSGASVVLAATTIFALAFAVSPKRRAARKRV